MLVDEIFYFLKKKILLVITITMLKKIYYCFDFLNAFLASFSFSNCLRSVLAKKSCLAKNPFFPLLKLTSSSAIPLLVTYFFHDSVHCEREVVFFFFVESAISRRPLLFADLLIGIELILVLKFFFTNYLY